MASDKNLKTFDQVVAEERLVLRGAAENRDTSPLSALCISGGGIRSATFGLGAIQGLADLGLLTGFDYLSTVSGGGYIGAWLTSWKDRAGGLEAIIPKLRPGAPLPKPDEVDPIGHLREYNNYLSPRLGFFSADAWTLAATVIRNMTLNWLVLVPLLMFALTAPRLILGLWLLRDTGPDYPWWRHFTQFLRSAVAPYDAVAIIGYLLAAASAFFFASSIFNTMRYLPGVGGKDHTEKDFLKYCLAPIIFAALGFITYDCWFDPSEGEVGNAPGYLQLVLWIAGSCAAGWVAYLVFRRRHFTRRFRVPLGGLTLAVLLLGFSTATAAWLLVAKLGNLYDWLTYTTFGLPLFVLSFMAAGALFVGFTSGKLGEEDREWLSRGAAWMLLFAVCWAGIFGLVLIAPGWIFLVPVAWKGSGVAFLGGVSGWISSFAGGSANSPSGEETDPPKPGTKARVLKLALKLAPPLFIAVLLIGLAILTDGTLAGLGLIEAKHSDPKTRELFLEWTRVDYILAGALVFFIISRIAARYININKFSLHAMYRSRLIRAYLGASNRVPRSRFTGFTQSDNILMSKLKPALRPFHVVNITLNLVAGKRLAWQQRKAESFTVSPLHCGSSRLYYRESGEYGGGISLGTAITISGAAASPNMGYHSSGAVGFIMTMFNARLGAWLGNPGKAGRSTWSKDGPTSAVGSLVKEAFGLTNDTSSYVYLSDGGHFENLGLYEMVMRGCGRIVVLDSGCDPNAIYDDLGNALRKIRIDMGIPIDFDDTSLRLLRDHKRRWAFATIRYSAVDEHADDGHLIYVKPMMLGNEPPDVATYQASHPDFPHQGTGNQWYDESQTESYRMLGLHTIQEMCEGWDSKLGTPGLPGLFAYLTGARAKAAAGGA